MPLPSRRLAAAAALLCGTVFAGESQTLVVGATVPPRASIQQNDTPATLTITPADIARGHVDVALPVAITVRSNTARGALLVFTGSSDVVEQTHVVGLAQPLQLGAAGGAVLLPALQAGRSPAPVALRFRFFLARGTQPGIHSWPLHMAAQPA